MRRTSSERKNSLFHSPLFVLPLLCTALIAAGCGSSHGSSASINASTTISTPTETEAPAANTSSTPGLHFNSFPTITLSDGLSIQGDMYCGAFAVLADPSRVSYDAATLAPIRDYLTAFYGAAWIQEFDPSNEDGAFPPLPPTLQALPGGLPCVGNYKLTNTGASTVQVRQVLFTLLAPVRVNTFRYALVDVCSVWQGCNPGANGQAGCGVYTTQVDFSRVHAKGDHIAAPLKGSSDPNCPVIFTLPPGATQDFEVDVTMPDATIYDVQPSLTVLDSSGQKNLPLPSSYETLLVSTDDAHIDCYTLTGGIAHQLIPSPGPAVHAPPNGLAPADPPQCV